MTRADREEKKKKERDTLKRFMHPNITSRKFCWDNGLTVYASCQTGTNKVKLFRQRGKGFLAVSERLYDQSDEKEVMEYTADIDREYERIYLKMKDKVPPKKD